MTRPLAGRALAALAVLSLAGCGPGSSPGPGTGGGPVSSVVVQLTRDGAIGQRYAAPGPRHCSPAGIPGDGAPSNGQAAA